MSQHNRLKNSFSVPDDFDPLDTGSDVSKQDILRNLRLYADRHTTHTVSMRDYDRWPYRIRSAQAIVVRFNTSWCGVCRLAGLQASRRGGRVFTPHELVQHLLNAYNDREINPHRRCPNAGLLRDYAKKTKLPITKSLYAKQWHSVHRCWQQVQRFHEGLIDHAELLAPLPAPAPRGRVYLLSDGDKYKLGRTRKSAEVRRKQQQTGNAKPLKVVGEAIHTDALRVDRELKVRFVNQNVRGEWYTFDHDDLDWLKTAVFKIVK